MADKMTKGEIDRKILEVYNRLCNLELEIKEIQGIIEEIPVGSAKEVINVHGQTS